MRARWALALVTDAERARRVRNIDATSILN